MKIKGSKKREFSFTQKRIEALSPALSGRDEYRDSGCPGMTLRVTAKGKKTFYFFRRVNGTLTRLSLGVFPETSVATAREKAAATQGDIGKGVDVAAERRVRRTCPALDEAFDYYMETYAKPHKRTWEQDKWQYEHYLKDRWGSRRLNTIRKQDAVQLHADIGREHGIYAANRLRSMIAKLFNVVTEAELFKGVNPFLAVKKFREQSRDRFLDAAELKRFFAALQSEPNAIIRDYLHLSLLVGARRSNMLMMRWEDIDREHGNWRIPQTKRGEPQLVPLSQSARDIIEQRWMNRQEECPWVFPSPGRHPSKSGHLVNPTKIWKEVLKRAKLENVRLHDLRRTLASWQAMLGSSELMIAKTLGHAQGSKATAVYARLQNDTIRESVESATIAMQRAGGLIDVEVKEDK